MDGKEIVKKVIQLAILSLEKYRIVSENASIFRQLILAFPFFIFAIELLLLDMRTAG